MDIETMLIPELCSVAMRLVIAEQGDEDVERHDFRSSSLRIFLGLRDLHRVKSAFTFTHGKVGW
jgi:hypothetical protein